MRYVGSGRKGNYGFSYHPYLILEDEMLKVMDAFSYDNSLQGDVRDKLENLPRYANLLYMSDDKNSSKNIVSESTNTVEITGM